MIQKETITLDAAALQMLVTGGYAKRGLNTQWTLVLKLNGSVDLKDGRSLQVDKEIHVKASQQGRKPNPARNWSKGQQGFGKKAKKS